MDDHLLKIVYRNYCVYCFFELKLQCEMKPDVELYLYYQHIAVYCKLLFVCSRGDTVQYHGGLRSRELGKAPRQALSSHRVNRWSDRVGYRIEIVCLIGTLSTILQHFAHNEIQ